MPKTRIQKEETVKELAASLTKANAVIFADYQQAGTSGSQGMTMDQFNELRKSLREVSSEFMVTKNTLLKKALEATNYPLPTTNLFEGPTATLFAFGDEITPIKALIKALKDTGVGKVKAGFLGQEALTEAKVKQLASLPSKEELRGQVVGVLAAPLSGTVTVLMANIKNLVYGLDQIRIQKGGE